MQKGAQTYDYYSYEYTRLEPFTKNGHSDTGDNADTLNNSVRFDQRKRMTPFKNDSATRKLQFSTRTLSASRAVAVDSTSRRLLRKSQSIYIKGT